MAAFFLRVRSGSRRKWDQQSESSSVAERTPWPAACCGRAMTSCAAALSFHRGLNSARCRTVAQPDLGEIIRTPSPRHHAPLMPNMLTKHESELPHTKIDTSESSHTWHTWCSSTRASSRPQTVAVGYVRPCAPAGLSASPAGFVRSLQTTLDIISTSRCRYYPSTHLKYLEYTEKEEMARAV